MRHRVLCVEDDRTMQTLVEKSLKDCHVLTAANLKEAELEISKGQFEAILLDIELPDGDGIRFYAKHSKNSKLEKTAVLFLSGHGDISNKLMAFSMGADDFITKPFDPLELSARVYSKIQKKRGDLEERTVRRVGNLEIDFDRQRVFLRNEGKEKDLQLTGIELKILAFLSRRMEQVYSREQILSEVWGLSHITDRTVDSHIAHLRDKIKEVSFKIDTVKNFGYRVINK